ncbi:hypothetical protein MSG28_011827 [Choristoneura fumiferana]|uniref:Uncharacterized protein n=1 Tax=Choristoneura fumiferana TaxID=7141 RepID=A0ACC0KNA1_CHOFU|nr:hypothetical protein MSG28_011827 [Choristoneura fumiferana]
MNPPSALAGAMGRERKPFSYLPGGLDLSQIKSERMAQRLKRNAMNQGVPEVPVQQIQSPTTPTTPVAVPNFSCLPVQVLPPGFSLPANPKSLLRSRSNPDRNRAPPQRVSQAPQFENPQAISQARIEQLQNNINKYTPQLPQPNSSSYNNRPTSTFEYGYSPSNNKLPQTSYGSNGHTAPLPEISYDAEYLRAEPKSYENREDMRLITPAFAQNTVQPKEQQSNRNTDFSAALFVENYNETPCKLAETRPAYDSNLQTTNLNSKASCTEYDIDPVIFHQKEIHRPVNTEDDSRDLETKKVENSNFDVIETSSTDYLVNLSVDDNIITHEPIESKPAEDLVESSDEQKQVKVVKKQVKKERKVEESENNAEQQNGDQNGNTDAELVVKLPTKKSGTKTETKVEVLKKSLPDGSVEEITKTTTKTITDGKTSIKTKTETRIIPKEEFSEEEVEEENEDVEEEVEEEPTTVVVKQCAQKEVVLKKAETTATTTSKNVVIEESNNQESEEEMDEEDIEPVKESKTVEKPSAKQEAKKIEVEEAEEEEEEEVVIVKKAVAVPEEKATPAKNEPEEVEEEEEEEEEEVVVVKKATPVEKKPEEVSKKEEEEDVEDEEEYEEAEEEVKVEVKKPEPKPEPIQETKPKEEEEESEYTEEEVESEHEEAPKPVTVEKQQEKQEEPKEEKPEPKEEKPEPKEEKPEPKEEKPEPKEEKPEEPQSKPEQKVPLREPSIPLEKVEDIEIKPIGAAETVTKSRTENTEITTSTLPTGTALSTQTEYNRVENIVTVNRTTKTLDNSYEQITQSGIPTMKTYFAPNRERVSTSPQPSKPYQPAYTPEPPKTERRHSLLLDRLSTERQMPGSEVYQNNYSNQYSNQTFEQQKQWSQEPQSEIVNVSNVKPSTITNSQWYQQSRSENVLYNNLTPSTAPPSSQLWSQPQQPQAQQQYQPSYTQSTQDYSKVSPNTFQQNSYPSYTPQPTTWGSNNLSTVDTIPSINIQSNQYSTLSNETKNYQKSSQQYSSSYVPPPWEQDASYVAPATSNFFQPRADVAQPPPATSTFSPDTHPGWKPTLPKTKFSKPPPKAYVPPAPNQSFVKNVNIAEPPPQPGRKTYYSEYERRYITVPESNYVPAESKFQAQPDPSPQYYYDNNEQPADEVEPQWRKELREFTEKTSQTQYQTQQTSVNPPWESQPNYEKTPTVKYTPTPSWSQTLRPQSWRERSFESELVSESQEWAKSNTLGRSRPVSSYVKSAEAPAPERTRGVSVDRYNPNKYYSPIPSEHPPPPVQTLTPATAPHQKGYHNPNVPAYHARASAEPREQPVYQQPRYTLDSRASPLQSRSFKYLQWITGTEE